MRSPQNVLVTGGSGFIGANFIHYLFAQSEFSGRIVNADVLTYAGNPDNLVEIESRFGPEGTDAADRYTFERCDICNADALRALFLRYEFDTVVHFAAESHVDRSISGPRAFIETNVIGTFNLLETARENWVAAGSALSGGHNDVLFHHVSTDEVFGSLGSQGAFHEETPYDPRSPYSASKASSDHLVRAYGHTYGLPFTISNCSNNYGPYQFPEKMIPLMILNALEGKQLPVYGDGSNVRDWLYVEDHADAIWRILLNGRSGETYLVGGENEWQNIKLVRTICDKIDTMVGKPASRCADLIRFVKDRPGHDLRYAVCCDKIKSELGWQQRHPFDQGLDATIAWYRDNAAWVNRVRTGAYQDWIEANYSRR